MNSDMLLLPLCTFLLCPSMRWLTHACALLCIRCRLDRDSIPLISCGASLTVIIPSAFVSFSSSSLASLRPPTRARIIAAGPFHNLVTWALLITAKLIGIGGWIRSMGYIDVSKIGRNVVSVEGVSGEFLSR